MTTLAPELVRLNEVLEEAARRDLDRRAGRWRGLRMSSPKGARSRATILAFAVLLGAGGIAFGISRALDSPSRDIIEAASSIGAERPLPADAIHLGGHTVWILKGGKGPAISILGDHRTSADLTVGCSAFSQMTAMAMCGGIQARGEPSLFVGRVSSVVGSVEATFPGRRRGAVALGSGVVLIEGPPAPSVHQIGARPTLVVARNRNGEVVASVRP